MEKDNMANNQGRKPEENPELLVYANMTASQIDRDAAVACVAYQTGQTNAKMETKLYCYGGGATIDQAIRAACKEFAAFLEENHFIKCSCSVCHPDIGDETLAFGPGEFPGPYKFNLSRLNANGHATPNSGIPYRQQLRADVARQAIERYKAGRGGGPVKDHKQNEFPSASAARAAYDVEEPRCSAEDDRIAVIVTAGPTLEKIDHVMQVTNGSTGRLGVTVTETLLNADGEHPEVAARIRKVYYLSHKTAQKPVVPDGQAYKLQQVQITDAQSLLDAVTNICGKEKIGLIVHSAAVGDYRARYSARAGDVAKELAKRVMNAAHGLHGFDAGDKDCLERIIMDVLGYPDCALYDETKISSCEPHLFTMMDLTPKVISSMRKLAPDACIIGFKLLDNVPKPARFHIGSELRTRNKLDYVVNNDLSEIKKGGHPAFIIGRDHIMDRDAIFAECRDKKEIAEAICALAFPGVGTACQLLPSPTVPYGPVASTGTSGEPAVGENAQDAVIKSYWHVIAANNMNTDVRIEGFAAKKHVAWEIMLNEFASTAAEMLPDAELPDRIEMDAGYRWDGENGAYAEIDAGHAVVYDGEDTWYYNLVPMAYGYQAAATGETPDQFRPCSHDWTKVD